MSALSDDIKHAALLRMKRRARPGYRTLEERNLDEHINHAHRVRMALLDERDTWETIRMYIEHAMRPRSWLSRLFGDRA